MSEVLTATDVSVALTGVPFNERFPLDGAGGGARLVLGVALASSPPAPTRVATISLGTITDVTDAVEAVGAVGVAETMGASAATGATIAAASSVTVTTATWALEGTGGGARLTLTGELASPLALATVEMVSCTMPEDTTSEVVVTTGSVLLGGDGVVLDAE